MKLIRTDIHIHTCLSPCAEISMSPKKIAEKAAGCGLNLLFITDHNTMDNVMAVMRAASEYSDLRILPGMEITSREEVHTLGLFEKIHDAFRVQINVYKYLKDTDNPKEYENQIIANEYDEVEGYLKKSLLSSVDLDLKSVVDLIHENNGLAIAAHIDRPSFSVISQLGFIPEDINYDAVEISANSSYKKAKDLLTSAAEKYKFVTGSDSHSLDSFGTHSIEFYGNNNSFQNFKKYLYG